MTSFDNLGNPKDWYENGYRNCYYSGILGLAYNLVHKLMESPYSSKVSFNQVLEVGSGNAEHFPHVRHNFETYFMTDIRQISIPIEELNPKIKLMVLDCTDLSIFPNGSMDRLIATCLLVHLRDPQAALQEWRRVVRPGGVITLYLAPEPGLLLRLIRRWFSWPKAKRNGAVNPELLAYQEHRNHYPGMSILVKTIFAQDQIQRKRYPMRLLGWNFSLFEIIHIKLLETERQFNTKSEKITR